MIFSILIPTYQNLKYLKLTINSIKKNSKLKHEILVHINGNDKKTENYLKKTKIYFTKSEYNIGLCSAVNISAKNSKSNYLCYSHDDMYFLPGWDIAIFKEIKKTKHNNFFFSATQIGPQKPLNKYDIQNHIYYDCGSSIKNFKEKKLLQNYKKLTFYDMQGSHWAPHVIHKKLWNKIGGFSEEFNPGFVSDPDLNMKLWMIAGVRIFKGINNSRIYHFGSLTTRKRNVIKRNNGKKTFLLKWGITVEHFVKFYMQRGDVYKTSLFIKKNFLYFISLLFCKIKYFFYFIKN